MKKSYPRRRGDLEPGVADFEPPIERIAGHVSGKAVNQRADHSVLALDHQPAEVPPEQAFDRTVGIRFFVRLTVMLTMLRDPNYRRFLKAHYAEYSERSLHPFRTRKATMCQQPVVTDINAEHAYQVVAEHREDDAGPTEEPR
jgi:hypothetical protein